MVSLHTLSQDKKTFKFKHKIFALAVRYQLSLNDSSDISLLGYLKILNW